VESSSLSYDDSDYRIEAHFIKQTTGERVMFADTTIFCQGVIEKSEQFVLL
jgi:hypothetical protein